MKSRKSMQSDVRRRIRGQGMTEYIIIVALIAVGAIAAVGLFGGVVKDSFSNMAQALAGGEATQIEVESAAEGTTEAVLGTF